MSTRVKSASRPSGSPGTARQSIARLYVVGKQRFQELRGGVHLLVARLMPTMPTAGIPD
jgi:hypothetical protein